MFISEHDAPDYLGGTQSAGKECLCYLTEALLLPRFQMDDGTLYLKNDLDALRAAFHFLIEKPPSQFQAGDLFTRGVPSQLHLSADTILRPIGPLVEIDRTYYAAAKNLAATCQRQSNPSSGPAQELAYFSFATVQTASPLIRDFIKEQLHRTTLVTQWQSSQFANSAYYMGSKRLLGGFIVEGIGSVIGKEGTIVDLMCGSGAAASAFSRFWPTIASDALSFCRLLAIVQGGGYTEKKAELALDRVIPLAREHADKLRGLLDDLIDREEEIFHGNLDANLLDQYRQLIDDTPTYPSGAAYRSWCPKEAVNRRQACARSELYCLFTSYFANIYFGLRQCIEIDSLRFAIAQLTSEQDFDWAMGSLIAATSAQGTTYGGHFAQPIVKSSASVTMRNLGRIIERRAASIMHEFTMRFRNLARESERATRPIQTVNGPWQMALKEVETKGQYASSDLLVYIDAPYKREEYSRYYHVLETLVLYNYPGSTGIARMPNRKSGELFRSEFFTRKGAQLEARFAELISEILAKNWRCAWSYSDNGAASAPAVIKRVEAIWPLRVKSFAAPFVHKAQGGQLARPVTEYLILIERA